LSLRSLLCCGLLLLSASCTTPSEHGGSDSGSGSDTGPDDQQDGSNDSDDGGAEEEDPDGGGSSKQKARVVSVAPTYAVAEENFSYRPKANTSEKAVWKIDQGPEGARVSEDGTTIEWQPDPSQKGQHELTISAKVADRELSQSGAVTVAVAEERATLDFDQKSGGSTVVTAPKSKVRGAGLSVRPSGLKSDARLSISEVDSAPDMAMAKSAPRAVHFGPKGTVFSDPAVISLPLPEGEAVDKSRVGAFVYDPKGRWVRVPVVAVDEEQGLVHAKAKHFSMYAAAQGRLALDLTVRGASASSYCPDSVFVDAWLREPLSAIDAQQIGNLPAELLAAAQGESADVAALLGGPGLSGSFRFVRVIEIGDGEGEERVILDTRLSVTTLYLPGDGSALVTHADALGNIAGVFSFPQLANALTTLWTHASGRATRATFSAPATLRPSVTARLHIVYSDGDASFDPVSIDDLGFAVVDSNEVAGQPSVDSTDTDLDCDGLVKAFDPVDNRLIPGVVARPEGVVSTSVGASVRLYAELVNADGEALDWEVLEGAAELLPVEDADSERDFVASEAGRFLVMASAEIDGERLSHVFAIDVSERAALPACTPSPASGTVKQGESVALSAVLAETSLADSALEVQWGLLVDEEFVTSDEITGRGHMAAFTPAYASRYQVACRARLGDESGALGSTPIDVVSAQSNLPPVDLTLSPSSATLLVGESLNLAARARDPEQGTLRFDWSASGGQLGTPETRASDSRAAFSAASPGLYEVRVAVRDQGEVPQQISAFVLVVAKAEDVDGADADNDGWPASLDCDDRNARVHPGAQDRCGDDIDDDCSGAAKTSDCDDDGVTSAGGDCDDAKREIRPGAAERCDGVDNDCDGSVDEGFSIGGSCSVGRGACAGSAKWVCSADGTAAVCPALPQTPSPERCDGVDNDCDGSVDEGYASRATQCGVGACAATGVTSCVSGREVDSCAPRQAAASDVSCDGIDDDCSGQADEDFLALAEVCNGRDDNCNGRADEGLSCGGNPAPGCTPKGAEACNAEDDDCDGSFDEDNVCGVIPGTESGLRGVFWECADAACARLGEGGFMFLAGGAALKLESFDHSPYDPADGPYCSSGSFQYTIAGDQLSVSFMEDGEPRTAQGTFSVAGAHASVHWTSGPSDMVGTINELVRVPEQPGGACPHGPVCQQREACGNGFDDDCDGRPDPIDPDCSGTCGGTSGAEICDGLDNDCNGQLDDLKQTCQRPDQQGVCRMGRMVCPQSGTQPTCEPGLPDAQGELCSDGLDNDCDGSVDEAGCTALTPGETCFNPIDASQGGVFTLAKGARNDVQGMCRPDSYVDRVFVINTPQGLSSPYVVRLDGSAMLDVGGALYRAPAGYTPGQGCPAFAGSEGMCLGGGRYPMEQYLDGGSTYLLVVEAAPDSQTSGGSFTLSVARSYDGICTPGDGDGDGVSICAGDCNDSQVTMHPEAGEICNQLDDDCDGFIDEQDGTCATGQAGVCATGLMACGQNPACQPIQHSTVDYCGDATDNDCDGVVDDNCVSAPGEACSNAIAVGNGGAFSGTLVGAADDAVSRCGANGPERFYRFSMPVGGGNVNLGLAGHPAGVRFALYQDCSLEVIACGFKSMYLPEGSYVLGVEADGPGGQPYAFTLGLGYGDVCFTPDLDGDGQTACFGDCDESNNAVRAGGSEGGSCDMIDNNCNGMVDDVQAACSVAGQNGVCAQGQLSCSPIGAPICRQTRFPDPQGRDICGDGVDNDCDGAADQQDPQLCTTVPAGDVCGLSGEPDISAGGTFSNNFAGYGDDLQLECGDYGTSGVERFYRLTLAQRRTVNIQLHAPYQAGDTGYVGMMLLADCAEQGGHCGTGYLQLDLDPGTYHVAVFGPATRSYTLLVSTREPGDFEGTTCTPGDSDGDGYTLCNGDCREGDNTTRPGANEVCDGVDNDCDMFIDNDIPVTPCSVAGGVGECAFGGLGCFEGSMQCRGPQPGERQEICADGKDQDCDGMADDSGQPGVACVVADGESCATAAPMLPPNFLNGSLSGARHDGNGCYGGSSGNAIERYYRFDVPQPGYYYLSVAPQGPGPHPPYAAGIFSGACANMANQGCNMPGPRVYYYYLYQPGPYYVVVESDEPFDYRIGLAAEGGAGGCTAPDADGDGYDLCNYDCAEGNPGVHPGQAEVCNGVDDNCDDLIDEGC
jgi:Putative metal-binding motif